MNSKTIFVALGATLAIVLILGLGAFFLLKSDAPAPIADITPSEPPPVDEDPVPPLSSGTTEFDEVPDRENVEFVVRVMEEGSRKLIRGASLVVQKRTDGDQIGEVVYPKKAAQSAKSTGEFELALFAGAFTVRASAHGYTSKTQRVTLVEDAPKEMDIFLSHGLTISGRVFDKDRKPIAGALVRAHQELGAPEDDVIEKLLMIVDITDTHQEPVVEAVTEPDGTYHLSGVRAVYYSVQAVADRYAPGGRKNIRPPEKNCDIVLADGSEIPGVVVDDQGSPIAGATVNVYPEVNSQDIFDVISVKARPPLDEVVSDSEGRFVLTKLGTGIYNFVVNAPQFQSGTFEKIRIDAESVDERTFRLLPGLVIAGVVVNPGGEPIAGAWVRPIRSGDVRSGGSVAITFDDGRVETDDEGGFEFDTLQSGRYSLLAWHEDYAAKQIREVELGNRETSITLPLGGAVRGKIVDARDGSPVIGARAVLTDLLDIKKEGITDATGEYYVGGLSASKRAKRYLSVMADGYARISNHAVRVQDGKVTEGQDFELYRTGSLSGVVVNSDGTAVSNARVMARRRSGSNSPVPLTVGSAVSGEDGKFHIESVEAGEATWLSVMSGQYLETESDSFNIQPGDHLEVGNVTLTLGGSIAGQVIDPDGRGVPGASVAIRIEEETVFSAVKTATTDGRGQFRIRGLLTGIIDLQVKTTDFLEEVVQGVEVKEAKETGDIRIELRRGNSLTGIVVDNNDQPVAGAQIVVTEFVGGQQEHRQITDTNGRFVVNTLLGTEPVEVVVEHSDFSPLTEPEVAVSSEEVVLRLDLLGGVRGVVVDASGNAMTSFSVLPKLHATDGSARDPKKIQSRTFQDDDGAFEFKGIPAGSYTVAINAPGFAAVSVTDIVVRNGEVADIGRAELQEGGVVDGTVLDAESQQPIEGARIRVQGGKRKFLPSAPGRSTASPMSVLHSDAKGYFRFTDLRGGSVTLTVSHEEFIATTVDGINVNDALESRNITVELGRGSEVVGTVVDGEGQPRTQLDVYLTGSGSLQRDTKVNQRTKTDAEGRFNFRGIRAGQYRVTARDLKAQKADYVTIDIDSGSSFPVDLVLD